MNLTRFSVATFNLYNLQDADIPIYEDSPWTKEEFAAKADWISRQLATLDADIVGLQELWSKTALEQVLTTAGLDQFYDMVADPATGDGIVCAARVRKGLLPGTPTWIDRFPDAVVRRSR